MTDIPPFHQKRADSKQFCSVKEAFEQGFNESFWRIGIEISQGNNMSVSRTEAIQRLNCIRRHLGRRMFGNRWRGKIVYATFMHGSFQTSDQHFHSLVGFKGIHDWSDDNIAHAIINIETERHSRSNRHWEKMAHVDWNWKSGNRYHSYVSRFASKRHHPTNSDSWEII
jgi:hypothetical protein